MIIEYDNKLAVTPEQRIQSLKESVQLAFNESAANSDRLYRSLLSALGVESSQIRNDFNTVAERIEQETSAISGAVEGALSRLSAVETKADEIPSIKSRLTNVESAVSTLQANYTALEARVTALEARVRALENA